MENSRKQFSENGNISRRFFLKGLAGMAALYISSGFRWINSKTISPNIILIIADNLGWRDLGCYGDPNIKSPNLDKLAKGGVRFTNAFVTAPSCSPSRASIISGQTPHSVNVLGLTHIYPKYQMSSGVPTLPRSLRDAGYFTAINGKWHVAPYKPAASYGYQKHLSMFDITV